MIKVGKRYGRLLVLSREKRTVLCVCICGTKKIIDVYSVLKGDTRSCGCLHRERSKEANTRHGSCQTPEYAVWRNMLSRCRNPKNIRFDRYGGRGIKVCSEWEASFEAFLSYVGHKPGPRYSLDRIDNDRNYEPGNVRWATSREQSRNRRGNRLLDHGGICMTIAEWGEKLGVSPSVISSRLYRGWTTERALSTTLLR